MSVRGNILAISLATLLVLAQWVLWVGQNGVLELVNLSRDVGEAQARNARLAERNRLLLEDVLDIKSKDEAIEEMARNRLGMVRDGERFFQVIERP
ncbi:MAG: cell division protein FtsB [Proteobacteria bacterium]|nr:MAG: cell division protein FtsB [Pseudomonadota bacterium]